MESTQTTQRRVRYQFEIFCMKVIDGERCDYFRQLMKKMEIFHQKLKYQVVLIRQKQELMKYFLRHLIRGIHHKRGTISSR